MKYLQVSFALCLAISLVAGQYFETHYSSFDGPSTFGLHSLSPDFNSPSAYSGSSFQQPIRDSRQDRGPVVFPRPPSDAPEESSGVIIGASGYGFVPPNRPQYRSTFPKVYTKRPTVVFDDENEIRSTFDTFGSTDGSSSFGNRLNRYSNRYFQPQFPFL